jgi:DNA-dependent RNA polymerase auxiliary subunit epsilon
MKKILLTAFLGFSGLAFSQEVKDKPEVRETDKALLVNADHAELDAKKKAAEEK